MRDVSAGGALLETAALPLGEEIRVEIEGDCSAFTIDAVVTRRSVPGADGSVGIRFVDRDPSHYAEWLNEECIRLSMWMCRDNAPLIATRSPVIPEPSDPAFIPVHLVFQIIKSQPGTSLDDLLGLESFDHMHLRIAVARLLESRAVTVTKPVTKEKAAPSAAKLMGRIRKSRWPPEVKGAAAATLVAGLVLGLTARNQGHAAFKTAVPAPTNVASAAAAAVVPLRSVGGDDTGTVVHARSDASVRSGPGRSFPLVEVLAAGDELLVAQKQGQWYRLVGDRDDPRWIHETLVLAAGDSRRDLAEQTGISPPELDEPELDDSSETPPLDQRDRAQAVLTLARGTQD